MARRVNTKFLILLTVVFVGGCVAVFAMKFWFVRDNPARFLEQGKTLMADRNWPQARQALEKAVALDRRNPEAWVLYGTALEQMSADEPEAFGKAFGAYRSATEVDPRNLPALRKQMEWHAQRLAGLGAENAPADVLQAIGATASKIVDADPTDREALAVKHTTTIRAWLVGIATDERQIAEAVAALQDVAKSDPANPDPPTYIARAYVRQAEELLRNNRGDPARQAEARKKLAAAVAVVDEAMKGQEKNALMSLRCAQVIAKVAQADGDPERGKGYVERYKKIIADAQEHVTPADPSYVEVRLAMAATQAREEPLAAEATFRDVADRVPHSPEARLALAQFLATDPARRPEAIELLVKPLPAKPDATAVDNQLAGQFAINGLAIATNLRIQSFGASTDAAERAKLKEAIDAGIARLVDRVGDVPATLKLKGSFQFLQGENVKAVQTLNEAMRQQAASGQKDPELQFILAKAYVVAGQTGQAKTMLAQVIERAPGSIESRLLLARLYLGDRQPNEAAAQLDAVERINPNAPELGRLRFQSLVVDGRKDKAREMYAKMPAEAKADRVAKAQAALQLDDKAEAAAVLESAIAAFPDQADLVLSLAQVHLADQQVDKAKAAVAAGLVAMPDSEPLKAAQAKLDASPATAAEAFAQAAEAIGKVTDDYTREMRLFDLERERGNAGEAMKHLAAADRAKPDDARVADAYFSVYLQQKKFDDAARYLPALAAANRDQAGGLLYRFRLAFAQGKLAEAEAIANDLTVKLPEFAQSWLSYGQVLQAAGKYDEAIDKFARALERQSVNLDAYKGLVDSYYGAGKPDDAARYIAQARKSHPNDLAVREAELNHALNYGNPEQVIPAREESLAADPEQASNHQALAMAYMKAAQFHAPRVNGAKLSDDYLAKARDLLAKAIERFPDDRNFYALYADACVSLGDFAGAEKTVKALAARDAWSDKPDPQLMLGELYARMDRGDDAEAAYRSALSKSDNALEVRQRLARFLAGRGKVTPALELLPASDPSPQVRRQRIDILSAAGMFEEAERDVRAALAAAPEDLEMQSLLGSVLLDRRQFDQASEQVAGVLAKDPKNLMALYVRGLVRMKQPSPDPDGAINDLQAVSDAQPKNVDVRLALADASRMRNDTDKAIGVIEGGLQVAPLNKQLRLRLLDLYVSAGRQSDVDRLLRESAFVAPLQRDAEWLNAESAAWAARGDFDKAAERMRSALALSPANLNLTNAYINLLIKGRNYRQAIAEAEKVVQAKDLWWAHQYKATAKRAMNDRAGAAADLAAALRAADAAGDENAASAVINTWSQQAGVDEAIAQLQPRLDKGVRWRLQAASLYLGKQDYAAARAMLDGALAGFDKATEADQLQVLRFAGSFYLSVLPAEPAKAQDAYNKLLEKTPTDLAALNNMACLLAEGVTPPRPDQAAVYSGKAYEQLRRLGRFDPMIYDTHGWVLVLSGKVDEGIDLLRQVANRAPFLEGHYHLGVAHLRQSTPYPEEAERQLKLAAAAYDSAQKVRAVDPSLKTKIDDSLARAREMLRNKEAGADAPAAGAN